MQILKKAIVCFAVFGVIINVNMTVIADETDIRYYVNDCGNVYVSLHGVESNLAETYGFVNTNSEYTEEVNPELNNDNIYAEMAEY